MYSLPTRKKGIYSAPNDDDWETDEDDDRIHDKADNEDGVSKGENKPNDNHDTGEKQNSIRQLTYAELAGKEGPWHDVENKRSKKKAHKKLRVTVFQTQDGKGKRQVERGIDSPKLIYGMKREPSMLMYVRNIAVHDRSEEEICRDMKIFGRSVGLRIMYTELVYNRYCEDVVGCKIRIPKSQYEVAVSIETWPDDIVCRKWAPKQRRNRSDE